MVSVLLSFPVLKFPSFEIVVHKGFYLKTIDSAPDFGLHLNESQSAS